MAEIKKAGLFLNPAFKEFTFMINLLLNSKGINTDIRKELGFEDPIEHANDPQELESLLAKILDN